MIELDIFQWDKHQFAQQDFTIPASYDTLERIDYAKVSREEFIERYEEKSLPVVIRGVMEGWGACKNWNSEVLPGQHVDLFVFLYHLPSC